MASASDMRDYMRRLVKPSTGRVIWTADIRARRNEANAPFLVIGGPGPVQPTGALVAVVVPVPQDANGFDADPSLAP